ncbi:MAG: fructosamine kinase family protein [Candidatus Sumerlaeia bacterium]|nr:fructosamine kinase family protein [Candidatus Sumerlaeia bacterium]
MNRAAFDGAVEELIARETGRRGRVVGRTASGGGCINNAETVSLDDGRRFFLKSNPDPLPRLFECEAAGLRALAEAGTIRVPHPVGTGGGESDVPPFLVMEWIEPGAPGPRYQQELGHGFARLHRETHAPRFGFEHDNYIGATPQPNGWTDDWIAFWRERRLGFQLALARRKGLSDSRMDRLGEKLLARLDEFLAEPAEPPCLLHGDLWGGNAMADCQGAPVLIDPAAYYGRREADLAMTQLFGGFTRDFYRAYEEIWPLAPGSDARLDIYRLYHLLNHLNLFGGSYHASCLAILRRYADG